METKQPLRLALVDDHKLFRKGMITLINFICQDCLILFEADNGIQLQQKLSKEQEPDIILMDITMPQMDGFASVEWLNMNFPNVKVIVVTMNQQKDAIDRMRDLGVEAYISKDVEPEIFQQVLIDTMNNKKVRGL